VKSPLTSADGRRTGFGSQPIRRVRPTAVRNAGLTPSVLAPRQLTDQPFHRRPDKRRFVEGNLERVLNEEPRLGAKRKLTGKEEALLVATACAKPPAGRGRWTLTLLADAIVKLTDHDSLSGETVRRRLADNDIKPWRREM
jgi:hypothetical protein